MKKLLYIHHIYQNKTKSNHFLREMLQTQYEVDFFAFDPYDKKFSFNELKNKKYDVLVLFQIMPPIRLLKKYIDFEHGIFFPMFDGVPPREDFLWYDYRNFRIINFSKTLHDELVALGFDSHYFQYFPKPFERINWGDEKSLFFWQRKNEIDITTVEKVINVKKLDKIHMHKAIDPDSTFVEPRKNLLPKCSFSTWFETKDELMHVMEQAALYFAPRRLEGIGLSFLEAMAMGRCVIAPDCPTMNEYIINNKTGLLYDYDDPQRIELQDISQIQKNTYEYIKQGYQEWEKKKFDILNILELPIVQNVQREKFFKPVKIAGLKIPFITAVKILHKKKYRLFNAVTLFKKVKNNTCSQFYLFDFILLLSIEKEK